jgi:non-heme chloroperoxidase
MPAVPGLAAVSVPISPAPIANASFKRERRNDGVTEMVEIEGRGHSLTIDSGWRDVCDKALEFVKRFV